jgi:hypothetical protein
MAVTANVSMGVAGSQTATADLGTVTYPYSASFGASYTTGTGAGQVDRVYTKTTTLSASGTGDIDLAGSLTDALGNTSISFARIKSIQVTAAAANTNNVQVTRPASNGTAIFMAAGDGISLRPGAAFAWASGIADATGVAVTAGTGDLITFTNSAGTTSVTYTVVITGCSA